MSDYHPDWFGGNADAAALIDDLAYIAHLWDDLVDADQPRTPADINKAFALALIDVPANPFYVAHMQNLRPLIHVGVLGYLTANKMEASGDAHQLEIAHGLRYAIANVAAYAVAATNEYEQTLRILPSMWTTMMPERFEDYAKEHAR